MPAIVDAVDIDETLGRVDVNELLAHIDLQVLIERLDLNQILDEVDLNALIDRIGIEQLLERIDLNVLLVNVDLNQLLERVDINALVDRVDVNAIMDDVDISAFTGKISSAVTHGTQSFLRSMLDLVRRQVVGLDMVILRFSDGMLRRQPGALQLGPERLIPAGEGESSVKVSGRYAGPVSRLLAFGLDLLLIFAFFALGTSILNYLVRLLTGDVLDHGSTNGVWWAIALAVWAFAYYWIGPAVAGRTLGMAFFGLRVVATDGAAIGGGQSFVRVLTLPLSVILLGIGLFMAVLGRQRKALHDDIAKTCVVYDWGERPAEMPAPLTKWLAGRGAIEYKAQPE